MPANMGRARINGRERVPKSRLRTFLADQAFSAHYPSHAGQSPGQWYRQTRPEWYARAKVRIKVRGLPNCRLRLVGADNARRLSNAGWDQSRFCYANHES